MSSTTIFFSLQCAIPLAFKGSHSLKTHYFGTILFLVVIVATIFTNTLSSFDSFGTIGGKVLSQSRTCTQDFLGHFIDGRSIMLHCKQGNLISVLEGFIGWPITPTLVVAYFVDAFMLWIQLFCHFMLWFRQYWFT